MKTMQVFGLAKNTNKQNWKMKWKRLPRSWERDLRLWGFLGTLAKDLGLSQLPESLALLRATR